MTTEDLLPSNNSSPRLSFSQDLIQPDNPFSPQGPATSSPNSDFDFNVSVEVAAAQVDPSPADELFSNGKILPLPLKNPNPNPNPNPSPDPLAAAPAGGKSAGKKSLWKLGRSASLNCARSGMMKINFLRSYSTGSDPDPIPNSKPQPRPSPNPNPDPKPPRRRSLKKGCGNGGNRDYRMSPVPLFPKERGLIGFLLCNCVGGGNNGGMDFYRSP